VLGYYLVAAWAALTHYFAVPVLLGHGAAALWLVRKPGPNRLPALRLLLAVGLAGLPYLAWLPVMRFQSRNKWDHLAPLTPGSLADSLADLFGLGGWGSGVGLALSLVVLGVAVFGVWAARAVRLPGVTPGGRLVTARFGWVLIGAGLLTAVAFAVAFPRLIEPTARQTLSGYGYDAAIVDEEVALLRQTGLLAAGCVALAGGIVFAWRRIEDRLSAAGRDEGVGGQQSNDSLAATARAGELLAFFLVVPVLVIALGGLTGIPFHQTRNLLVMLPGVCVAWGFALDRLMLTRPGSVVAVALVAGMTFAAGQYHAAGRIVGRDGPRLGMDTINWRDVRTWLTTNAPDGRSVVLVNRPPTDPGLHYLAAFKPTRMPPDAVPPDLPPRIVFIHLVGNTFSERAKDRLTDARGPFTKVAQGSGWEIYATRPAVP
jgi:hypothetical protein